MSQDRHSGLAEDVDLGVLGHFECHIGVADVAFGCREVFLSDSERSDIGFEEVLLEGAERAAKNVELLDGIVDDIDGLGCAGFGGDVDGFDAFTGDGAGAEIGGEDAGKGEAGELVGVCTNLESDVANGHAADGCGCGGGVSGGSDCHSVARRRRENESACAGGLTAGEPFGSGVGGGFDGDSDIEDAIKSEYSVCACAAV